MDTTYQLDIRPTYKQHQAYEALRTPILREVKNEILGTTSMEPLTIEVFFGGGADGGKSWAICESRLKNALEFPGYKSFIGRHELKRLMQSTYKTWLKVCRYHNIPREEWKLDGNLHTIKFLNGSEIDLLDLKFLPTEDPLYERFGSLEYSDGAIEEAGEVHPLAREVMKSRCGRWRNKELGINPSLLETGNPKKNWTYHLFYKPWTKGTLPDDMHFIQALHRDNQYGEASYALTLDHIKDETTRARLRDGNWEYEDDPAALINYAAIADLFSNTTDDSDDEDAERYMTVDVARKGKDKTVVTLWRGWHAFKILYKEKQDTRVTAEWIKGLAEDYEIAYSHICIDEDGVGGGVVDNVRGVRGFLANASAVETLEEEDDDVPEQKKAFANIKTQCAYHLANRVNRHEASVRTKDEQVREWLAADLEQIKEQNIDDDGKRQLVPKAEVSIILGRSPDFGDTFLMRAVFDLKPPKQEVKTWSYRKPTPQRRRK